MGRWCVRVVLQLLALCFGGGVVFREAKRLQTTLLPKSPEAGKIHPPREEGGHLPICSLPRAQKMGQQLSAALPRTRTGIRAAALTTAGTNPREDADLVPRIVSGDLSASGGLCAASRGLDDPRFGVRLRISQTRKTCPPAFLTFVQRNCFARSTHKNGGPNVPRPTATRMGAKTASLFAHGAANFVLFSHQHSREPFGRSLDAHLRQRSRPPVHYRSDGSPFGVRPHSPSSPWATSS